MCYVTLHGVVGFHSWVLGYNAPSPRYGSFGLALLQSYNTYWVRYQRGPGGNTNGGKVFNILISCIIDNGMGEVHWGWTLHVRGPDIRHRQKVRLHVYETYCGAYNNMLSNAM